MPIAMVRDHNKSEHRERDEAAWTLQHLHGDANRKMKKKKKKWKRMIHLIWLLFTRTFHDKRYIVDQFHQQQQQQQQPKSPINFIQLGQPSLVVVLNSKHTNAGTIGNAKPIEFKQSCSGE